MDFLHRYVHGAKEVDLFIYPITQSPSILFYSKTLVDLKLDSDIVFHPPPTPTPLVLLSLKILHLRVQFENMDSVSRLVTCCLVLQHLYIG